MGGGLENYGADSELGRYLVNRDGACDYGDVDDPAEIDAYKVQAQENIKGYYQGVRAARF